MARAQVQLTGGRRLRRELTKAGISLDDLVAVHRRIAATVAQAATPPQITGALAGTVRSSGTRTASVVRAGYARVPYAGVVEWGWPARHVQARPYLVPAAQRTEPVWVGMYTDEIARLLARVESECSSGRD